MNRTAPVLAGRRTPLSDFETIFGNVRSPSYATLLWGLRGTGKTVLLNAFEGRSAAHGWLSIAVAAATPMGLLNDISHSLAQRCPSWNGGCCQGPPAPSYSAAIVTKSAI
ncbi:ATP-binding protein [Candidatus Poriferisodalis sp.]|uniref:ATP-binding protein n=1 Tax=Candidatus Poriferisodalis sp. TaxID=3101277 RepID=UPI003B5C119D